MNNIDEKSLALQNFFSNPKLVGLGAAKNCSRFKELNPKVRVTLNEFKEHQMSRQPY